MSHITQGVGWGGAITFTYLCTSMMWCHGTFTCTCAHTSCYVEDVSHHAGGRVGWGNNVHLLARFYDVTPRHVHLHLHHSKGVFSVWRSVRRRGSVRVHTGGIDAYWTLLKDGIPNSINSTVGGKPNKVLWTYMRSQQWRWECHDKDILAENGQTLATLWTKKKARQYLTRFKTQNPVRVNDIFLK